MTDTLPEAPLAPFEAIPTLYVTTGLPGCGKTRWAKMFVAAMKLAGHKVARLGRDELRDAIHYGCTDNDGTDAAVTVAQHAAVAALLADGYDVVCDDGAIVPGRLEALEDVARAVGAQTVTVDFTRIGVEECIRRDRQRPRQPGVHTGGQVGAGMILDLAQHLPERAPA